MSLRERLYSRLVPDLETGCLLWTGTLRTDGYGVMFVGRLPSGNPHLVRVHRVAWELENGPIPDGLVIDHVKARGCRHRNCANVAHLEPVTDQVNILRGVSPAARYAAQTHCSRGHEFDLLNTYFAHGRRYCRACRRANAQQRKSA